MFKYSFIIMKTTQILLWIFHELTLFLLNLLLRKCDSFLNYSKSNHISKYRILILYSPSLTPPSTLHTAKSNKLNLLKVILKILYAE